MKKLEQLIARYWSLANSKDNTDFGCFLIAVLLGCVVGLVIASVVFTFQYPIPTLTTIVLVCYRYEIMTAIIKTIQERDHE